MTLFLRRQLGYFYLIIQAQNKLVLLIGGTLIDVILSLAGPHSVAHFKLILSSATHRSATYFWACFEVFIGYSQDSPGLIFTSFLAYF